MISLVYLVIGFASCIFQVIESTHQPEITVITEVVVGFTVDLTCSYPAEANNTRTFKWYVNDTQSSTNPRYNIKQQHILRFLVKKTDKYNVYKCEVDVNTTGNQEYYFKTITLQPKYPPTIRMPSLYVCNRFQNINLSCKAEGYPAMYTFSNWEHRVGGTVIRHLPGVIIDNISYLQLSHCTYQDKGTYFCTVGNNISHPNNTMTSVAIVDIRIKELECKITALGTEYKGQINVTTSGIQCKKWTSDVSLFKEYVGDQENYCRNPDFTSGGPWCYTQDPAIRWEHCDVQYCVSAHQPQIAVSPEVIVGKTVDLTCSYPVELNKTRTFKWYVNDIRSSATTQPHILQFNVTKTDKYNVYKCEVEVTTAGSNERPLFDKTIKLQPKYPPTIHMQPSYVCNRLQNITLSCEADGSPAKYKFSDWEHRVGGTVIQHLPGEIVGNISYLQLSHCTYQDTGTYYCTVGNNVTHPNNTKTSVASVDFKVKDYPVVIGHSIVNTTNNYDIMISYYSYPMATQQKLYRDGIQLVFRKFSQNLDIPFLIRRKIVPIEGTVLVINVSNSGDYRYVIHNDYGSVNGTVDVWSRKTPTVHSGLSADEPLLCSFMSLGFQLQVVIIVVTGVVVCVVVLAVAMIVIRRCGSSDSSRDKIKETQKERRLTRVRSVLEDGTVVYDEVDDSKWTQAKKEKKEKKAKKKKIVNCHVPEAYEDVGVKNPGQSYEMLHKHNSKSKPFFRKKSSKVAKRMEILTTSGPKGTHENLYSTNSSNPDHYDNTEITSDVKTSLSKDEIPLPKRGYRNESIIVYDDATSNSKLNTSCKAMVHEPSEYITMKAKCLKETSFKNKESSSMKDNEYTSMKNKEHTSKQSNESKEKDDNDTDEALYVNLKLA